MNSKLFEVIYKNNKTPKTNELLSNELESIIKRTIKNPNNIKIDDDIHYIGQLQSTAGLTTLQKKVLAQLYDELMGNRNPATLKWIFNKWI